MQYLTHPTIQPGSPAAYMRHHKHPCLEAAEAQGAAAEEAAEGGGGGGGGGGAAPPAQFAGLYSVMWDCNAQTTAVILDSNLDAEIVLIADSESFTPAPDPGQNLDGRTIYTAGAYADIMLLKVSAGGASASETINTLGRCNRPDFI